MYTAVTQETRLKRLKLARLLWKSMVIGVRGRVLVVNSLKNFKIEEINNNATKVKFRVSESIGMRA